VLLKGFREPLGYHELLWGQQLYGVKSASVSASTDRLRPTHVILIEPASVHTEAVDKLDRDAEWLPRESNPYARAPWGARSRVSCCVLVLVDQPTEDVAATQPAQVRRTPC
jgi:hypothetical protein